ncbi:MAG: phosphodiester glycosidase family protein, partial [Bacteroidetes bacterium]|nr:phosphodiester glycosidase family protein [Bacteroidota bacterium]
PNEVKAANVQSVTRNGLTYPVIRSFFGMKKDRNLSVDWIYQFGNAVTDLYTFPQPLPYVNNDPSPRPAPSKSNGTVFADLLTGIGGGPMLIRNDSIKITYAQELMWGSGVGETNNDPRTAVGYTANKHVIIIVADGRQAASEGVSLTELASIMKGLGCIGAMNLDGGGSTQMAVPNQYINTPSESRPVPAILAVVHADSLNLPKEPLFRRIIDTGDTNATALGGGWFESANPGYWSTTKAQLHPIGTGTGKYEFRPHLPAKAVYSVYGWWVASSNRATDVPFIIERSGGTDTVRVDQVANGSSWKLIGTYEFTGTASDKVTISDAAKTNNYVVADAVKFESVDPNVLTGIRSLPASAAPSEFTLEQNFPNPFNPETTISFTVPDAPSPVPVSLTVQDLVGRTVTTLVKVNLDKGSYQYRWNAAGLPSGVYFCRLQAGSLVSVKRMVLLK